MYKKAINKQIQTKLSAPASGLNYWPGNGEDPWNGDPNYQKHEIKWYERQANRYAATYFGNKFNIPWDHEINPIWIPPYKYKHRERPSVLTLYP